MARRAGRAVPLLGRPRRHRRGAGERGELRGRHGRSLRERAGRPDDRGRTGRHAQVQQGQHGPRASGVGVARSAVAGTGPGEPAGGTGSEPSTFDPRRAGSRRRTSPRTDWPTDRGDSHPSRREHSRGATAPVLEKLHLARAPNAVHRWASILPRAAAAVPVSTVPRPVLQRVRPARVGRGRGPTRCALGETSTVASHASASVEGLWRSSRPRTRRTGRRQPRKSTWLRLADLHSTDTNACLKCPAFIGIFARFRTDNLVHLLRAVRAHQRRDGAEENTARARADRGPQAEGERGRRYRAELIRAGGRADRGST